MTIITLTKTHQNPPQIVQSRIKRDWMDNTYKKHAYQCLPMTAANVHGWELILPQDVVVQWEGGNNNVKILSGEEYMGRTFVYGGIIGMVSFSVGWAFGTEKVTILGLVGHQTIWLTEHLLFLQLYQAVGGHMNSK